MPFEIKYGNPYAVPGVGEGIFTAAEKEVSFARMIENAKLSLSARAMDLQQSRDIMNQDQSVADLDYKRKYMAHQDEIRKADQTREDARLLAANTRQDSMIKDERTYNDGRTIAANTRADAIRTEDKTNALNLQTANFQNEVNASGGRVLSPVEKTEYDDLANLAKADPATLQPADKDRYMKLQEKYKPYEGFTVASHPSGSTALVPTTSAQRMKTMREEIQMKNQIIAEQELNPKEITKQMIASDKSRLDTLKTSIDEIRKDLNKNGDEYKDEYAESSPRYLALKTQYDDKMKNTAWLKTDKNDPAVQEANVIKAKMDAIKNSYVNPYEEKAKELAELQKMHRNIQSRMGDPESYSKINDAKKYLTEYLKTSQNETGKTRARDLLDELDSGSWNNAISVVASMKSGKTSPVSTGGKAVAANSVKNADKWR